MKLSTRLKVASKIITTGNVKSAFSVLLNPGEYRRGTAFGNDFWLFSTDGLSDRFFSYTDAGCSLKAFDKCPPVAAIINRKAQSYINGKTYILNSRGKEADSEPARKIKRLLQQPNVLQSGKQFEAQAYMYQQLYGYAIVLMIKPNGFPNLDAKSMWLIPNWMCSIEESEDLFYNNNAKFIKRITLTYKNQRTELPIDNVFFIKDFRPSFHSLIFPESRIKSLEMPINNVIGAYESRNVLITERGPMWLMSKDGIGQYADIPWTPDEKKNVENDFKEYGLTRMQKRVIIASSMVKLQSMGYDVGQLKLMEEVQESAKSICDGFGYPPHLLGLLDPTFNNQNAAEKGLYQNTIIPEAESNYEQWSELFEVAKYNLQLQKDFSHVTVLQEDKQKNATARKILSESLDREFRNNWITYNRVLELLDEDTVPGMDKYYKELLEEGYVFGSVVNNNQQNNNTENTANNG